MFKALKRFIRWLYRDALTGKFVSKKDAEANPRETVCETVRDEGDKL